MKEKRGLLVQKKDLIQATDVRPHNRNMTKVHQLKAPQIFILDGLKGESTFWWDKLRASEPHSRI